MSLRKNKFGIKKKVKNGVGGYTLIEMVVVVGSLGVIIVAIISTILLTFRTQNMVKSNSKISENGRNIVAELRRNIFNGDSNFLVCDVAKTSVTVVNRNDMGQSKLICLGNYIASISAGTTVYLHNQEVTVSSCQNFAVCQYRAGTTDVVGVAFNFGLEATTVGVGASQFFNTKVTTRN